MSVDRRLQLIVEAEQKLADLMKRADNRGSDGGGGMDDNDRRITRLENQSDRIQQDLNDIKVQMATLAGRVDHLPSKGFILTALCSTVAVMAGLAAIARALGFVS